MYTYFSFLKFNDTSYKQLPNIFQFLRNIIKYYLFLNFNLIWTQNSFLKFSKSIIEIAH